MLQIAAIRSTLLPLATDRDHSEALDDAENARPEGLQDEHRAAPAVHKNTGTTVDDSSGSHHRGVYGLLDALLCKCARERD